MEYFHVRGLVEGGWSGEGGGGGGGGGGLGRYGSSS